VGRGRASAPFHWRFVLGLDEHSAVPGRVILITGANGRLGLAIAEGFLAEPGTQAVWLGVRKNRGAAEELQARDPDRVRLVDLEVTNSSEWQHAVQEVTRRDGRLDVLVNNAGHHRDGLLAQLTDEDWHGVIASNLTGTFLGCRAVLPTLISQRSGRIVNVSSLSALLAPAGQANYAAAKAGVVALTQSLAKEVARIGITVNAVCPGYVETDALASLPAEARTAATTRIPMRRFGRPEEIAASIRFLASPEASYVTGAVLKADGGIL
jgi:3-oxoacyl-[acyl-carrier protein] reductase